MKRDMDLARKLLLFIEENGNDRNAWIEDVSIEGYTDEQINYHLWQLADGGFIEILDSSSDSGTCYEPRCLTWAGSEFLETIRDKDNWEKTKDIAKQVGAGSWRIIMEIGTRVVQDRLASLLV